MARSRQTPPRGSAPRPSGSAGTRPESGLRAETGDRASPPPTEGRGFNAFRMIILPSVGLVVLLLFTQGWFMLADSVTEGWGRWAAAQKKNGWTITTGTPQRRGYPAKVEIGLPMLRITGAAGGLEAESASLTFNGWAPGTPIFRISGPVTLTLADGQKLTGTVDEAKGSLKQASGGTSLAVTLSGFRGRQVTTGVPVTLDSLTLSVDPLAPGAGASDRTPVYRLAATLKNLILPQTVTGQFGTNMPEAVIQAEMRGPFVLPGSGSAKAPGTLTQALQTWRDGGGTLELQRLYLDWAPLKIGIAGTMALDEGLQPEGAFSTSINGLMPMLDRLERQGIIRGRDASVGRVLLGAMGQRAADGTVTHTLPLSIQNQKLTVGPVPLMAVPPIRWGDDMQPTGTATPAVTPQGVTD